MPFYDYVCIYCEHICEKFHSMTDNRNDDSCEACHKELALKKIPSHINVKHDSNVGQLVTEFIRENKEITKKEKQNLSKQEYKK